MDPQTPIQTSKKDYNMLFLFLLIFLTLLFTGGYFLHITFKQNNVKITVQDTPSIPTAENDNSLFLPGKTYFDDRIVAITKDIPHQAIALSARRTEQDKGFNQSTGFSYFDGSTWSRKQESTSTPNSQIVTNSLIKTWENKLDLSRVLKESVHTLATIEGNTIEITAKDLTNEIGMRSNPGYTEFMSNAIATMKINGKSHDAYLLYTHIYSLNTRNIQLYTTYWIAFWDENGYFYHIDKSEDIKPTDVNTTHQIAVSEWKTNNSTSVNKSFSVDISPDKKTLPTTLTIKTNDPIHSILNITRLSTLNKAPSNSYTWVLSTIEGSSKNDTNGETKGVGLMEYNND